MSGVDAAIDRLVAKHEIHRLQDRRFRAERIGEGDRIEFQPGSLELRLQLAAALVEFTRGRTLKRKDRLLFVADCKHRAQYAIARAGTRSKFGNDVGDDVPLPRTCILRLVDQHVVDATVQLVMHPARRDAVEHLKRLVDQIVIVEQAPLELLAAIVRSRCGRNMQQRLGAVAHRHRATFLDQGSEPVNFGFEQAANGRIVPRKILGHHRFAGRAVSLGQEDAQIFVHLRGAGERQGSTELRRLALVGFAPGIESGRDVVPARSRQVRSIQYLALDILDAIVCGHTKRRRDLSRGRMRASCSIGPRHEVIAAEASLAHHILEGDVGGAGHCRHQRAPGRAIRVARGFQQHGEIGALHHLVLVAVVEHGKARWHVGLERKLLQQAGA